MQKTLLSPKEVANKTIETAIKKANLPSIKMLLLGIFAGLFIGFGAHGYIIVTQTLGKIDIGLAKFIGAAVFPVGLMLVIIAGAELFTGNNIMTLALMKKKITCSKMLKNWIIVYIGNFIGSIFLAYILSKTNLYTGIVGEKAIAIASAKVNNLTLLQGITRAILCNMIVVLAVWMATAATDVTGKILAVWFPIMIFVLSGFEHSIANMFFIPMGKFIGAGFSWGEMWINNIIPVTIGNLIGGAIIVPIVYYICYAKDK
ncbi:formate/nitrite transporter family protein [Abyssisolibacter fermentans]|uniref:formate/nitrite transporter family protein n=1 Tax=Abyssisolibacter fermentans TaxID=1766203 RepID=UPI000832F1DC|nr:formate/nitrite transporter family protein [Abyssisolibacter fermentans]